VDTLVIGIITLPVITPILWGVLIIMEILALFGGFTVWAGVFVIWQKRYGTRKFLIGVGTGFGLTSLIFTTILVMLFPAIGFLMFFILFTVAELIGIIFSVLARYHVVDPSKEKKK
jgi:hypothetical protein